MKILAMDVIDAKSDLEVGLKL